jgi:MFS family permease
MLSLATFGAGFVTRPIGALVIGAYSDRVGRKPAMLLCFTLIGVSIVAMALIPSYAAIGVAAPILAVIARMVQGFSLGGEIGSNTAFLLEAAVPEKRGLVVSWQRASQYVALTTAGAVGAMLTAWMPPQLLDAYGWLSDRIGRWPVNVWGNLAFVVLILPVFYWITQARTPFALIVGVTGLSAAAAVPLGSFFAALAESLPKTIRGSGFGTVYSLSIAAFGGTTQLMVTWLLHVTGNALAPAFYLVGAASIGQVALMMMAKSAPAPLARRALALAVAPSVGG